MYLKGKVEEAKAILLKLHSKEKAEEEAEAIATSILNTKSKEKIELKELLKPGLRFIFLVGLTLGILQQITGINAIYFYATSIFKQTGIGTNAAFAQGVLLSVIALVFTIISMLVIDKVGRRPLLLVGIAGIAISLLCGSYGFNTATYKLTEKKISILDVSIRKKLTPFIDKSYDSDVVFKREMKAALGTTYAKNDGAILEAAIEMNAVLVLIGILGFVACFAFSLGPVMWVMLSEIFPNKYLSLIHI